jgi:hypothetical protein
MADEHPPVAAVVTAPIQKGSLVLISGKLFGNGEEMAYALNELRRVAGHEQFLVVQCPEGTTAINVAGPDDLIDALRRLAKENADAPKEAAAAAGKPRSNAGRSGGD